MKCKLVSSLCFQIQLVPLHTVFRWRLALGRLVDGFWGNPEEDLKKYGSVVTVTRVEFAAVFGAMAWGASCAVFALYFLLWRTQRQLHDDNNNGGGGSGGKGKEVESSPGGDASEMV